MPNFQYLRLIRRKTFDVQRQLISKYTNGVMTLDKWTKTWENKIPNWHLYKPHEFIVKHLDQITHPGAKIFIPLCGKTVDIKWMYDKGYHVHGIECAETPIKDFFRDYNLDLTRSVLWDDIAVFKTKDSRIQLFHGDFFKFSKRIDLKYDVIWDRASFIAVNIDERVEYINGLKNLLTKNGTILLATFHFDPSLMSGPPHLIVLDDVIKYFGDNFNVKLLDTIDVSEEILFKTKKMQATEELFLITLK